MNYIESNDGHFQVKVILDSITPHGKRLTTITSRFPRIILAEVNTHRDKSRNAASSRAIPFPAMSRQIDENPFIPIAWGLEQKGMQQGDTIPVELASHADKIWLEALAQMQKAAARLHNIGHDFAFFNGANVKFDEVKIHKSICNRLLEPWMWCTQVMSATEWDNFFRLRCHKDAEQHFQKIACMIRDALAMSEPKCLNIGEWHTPFILPDEDFPLDQRKPISVARCARVSYLTHEGVRDPSKDLELFNTLVQGSGFGHWSPHEHVAECVDDPTLRSGPFIGWKQFRKEFPLENSDAV